jgi:hypothetical protein
MTTRIEQQVRPLTTIDAPRWNPAHDEAADAAIAEAHNGRQEWSWHVDPSDRELPAGASPQRWYTRLDDLIKGQAWCKMLGG